VLKPATDEVGDTTGSSELTDSCEHLASLTRAAQSPVHVYMHSFSSWLHETPYQAMVAFAALAVGIALSWDGPGIWQALFSLSVAGAAAGVACME
ncbi:unnamed protein product, partial [Polarella glacialis]